MQRRKSPPRFRNPPSLTSVDPSSSLLRPGRPQHVTSPVAAESSSSTLPPLPGSMIDRLRRGGRGRSRTPYWFWCAICFLSFCSALFCVGLVNTLLVQHYYLDEDVTSQAYTRRQMKRKKQKQHRMNLPFSDFEHGNRGQRDTRRIEDELRPPQAVELARAWEEEAAFGLDEEALADNNENNVGDNLHTQNNGDLPIAERYSDMIQSRRDERDEGRREYDRRRQRDRRTIRRSTVSKRVVGGIYYNPDADKSPPKQSWISWLGQRMGLESDGRDQEESVFDSGDLPEMDFRDHFEALVKGWEKEGIFWNYSLPAVPNAHFSLAAPEPRASKVVVIVLSTRQQVELRQVIRETWGKDHAVYFVVGGRVDRPEEDDAQLESDLQQEANQHRDILDTIHPESYRSLPYKLHFAYQFVVREIPEAKWILKLDEDMVARIGTLEEALLSKLNPEQPFVLGKIVPNAKVSRVGKWAEYFYQQRYYPFWPKGSHGHVVSRPVAQYVASMTNPTYYQGEDTSLGIWLSESPLRVNWICSPYFQNHGRCEEDEWIVIGHQIGPEHMRECFDKLDEWQDGHFEDKQRNFWFVETRAQRKWMSDVVERRRQDGMFPMFS